MTVAGSASKKRAMSSEKTRGNTDNGESLPPQPTSRALKALPTVKVAIPLSVKIPSFETKSGLIGLNYTTYNIKVDDFGRTHSVNRRFDDFLKFYEHISSLPYRGSAGRRDPDDAGPASSDTLGTVRSAAGDPLIPTLPPKQMFGSTLPAVVEERRPALELILQRAVKREEILSFDTTDALWKLLELPAGCATVSRFLTPSGQRNTLCIHELSGLLDPEKSKEQYRLRHESTIKCLLNMIDNQAQGTISLPSTAFASIMDVLHYIVSYKGNENAGDNAARQMFVCGGGVLMLLRILAREGDLVAPNGDVVVVANRSQDPPSGEAAAPTGPGRIDQVKRVLNGLIQASGEGFSAALLTTLESHDGITVITEQLLPTAKAHLHDTVAKLLWLGFDEAVQACLLEHPRGLDLLGSLFASPFPSTRVICGLLLATLASASRLDDASLLSKIDSGLWQLLTTELLPSECFPSSARVPGSLLAALTRTPGCVGRLAQCLAGHSSQTVKGFVCWVLNGSSSALRPDSQLSKTIVAAGEALILQLIVEAALRPTPGECVAVDESLRAALEHHMASRGSRNAEDIKQQEGYLESLVSECAARSENITSAVVPAELNSSFKSFDKYLSRYLQTIQDTDAMLSKCKAGINALSAGTGEASASSRLPELDSNEVVAWATSALELQEVENEMAQLNGQAEAAEEEMKKSKKEAVLVDQQLKKVTADLKALDARIISEGTAPGEERQQLADERSRLDGHLLQLKQVTAAKRLEVNNLRQRAAELATGRGAAAASSASGKAALARGDAIIEEWVNKLDASKRSTRQVHKLSEQLSTVGLRLQQNEKGTREELVASVRALKQQLSRLEDCLAQYH
ncbi:hypothetical protein FOL47_007554 [Perkinsus chesapeaki]|uniref:PX domain-containing protein n=1 Tax=Perkinsus chesapeaki TaxID=330153 RepID=A0A7J6MVF2_PERCH|nr:hypothetical protein FOL47_007554 [Perkinsus chesapeaki]